MPLDEAWRAPKNDSSTSFAATQIRPSTTSASRAIRVNGLSGTTPVHADTRSLIARGRSRSQSSFKQSDKRFASSNTSNPARAERLRSATSDCDSPWKPIKSVSPKQRAICDRSLNDQSGSAPERMMRGSRSLWILTGSVVVIATLAGCSQTSTPSRSAPAAGAASIQSDRLFFGRNIPGGGTVADFEWATFLAEVVTPRLPHFVVLFGRTVARP